MIVGSNKKLGSNVACTVYLIFIFFEFEISKVQKLIPIFFLLLQLQSLTGGLTSLFGKKADPVPAQPAATTHQQPAPAPAASGGMFSGFTNPLAPAAAAPVPAAAPAPVQPAQPVTLDFIPGLDDEPVPAAKPAAAAAKPATSEAGGGLLGGLTGGLTSGLSNLAGGAGAATGKLGDAGGAAAGAVGGVLKMGGGMFKKFGF